MNVHANAMAKPVAEFCAVTFTDDDLSGSRIYFGGGRLSGAHGGDSGSLGIHHKFVDALKITVGLAEEDGAAKIVAVSLVGRPHIE